MSHADAMPAGSSEPGLKSWTSSGGDEAGPGTRRACWLMDEARARHSVTHIAEGVEGGVAEGLRLTLKAG